MTGPTARPLSTVGRPHEAARVPAVVVAAMVGSAACWGLATVMSKGALAHLPPFTLIVTQLLASVAFLWTATLIRRRPVPLNAAGRRAALSGVLEPGLAYAAGTSGLVLTGAAHASLIAATEPLLIVLLAWTLFRNRPSPRTLSAIGVAVIGIALVTVDGDGGASTLLGDALIVLATLFAALYVTVTSRLAISIEPLPLAALQQSIGLVIAVLLLVIAAAAGFERVDLAAVPTDAWLLAIVSGLVQYALAFWLYLIGLRVLPVASAALYLALTPVFGTGGAVLLLGERLTIVEMLGCALVIAAVVTCAERREPTVGAGTRTADDRLPSQMAFGRRNARSVATRRKPNRW